MAVVSVLSLRQERERGEGAALVGVEARKEGEKKRPKRSPGSEEGGEGGRRLARGKQRNDDDEARDTTGRVPP